MGNSVGTRHVRVYRSRRRRRPMGPAGAIFWLVFTVALLVSLIWH